MKKICTIFPCPHLPSYDTHKRCIKTDTKLKARNLQNFFIYFFLSFCVLRYLVKVHFLVSTPSTKQTGDQSQNFKTNTAASERQCITMQIRQYSPTRHTISQGTYTMIPVLRESTTSWKYPALTYFYWWLKAITTSQLIRWMWIVIYGTGEYIFFNEAGLMMFEIIILCAKPLFCE